MCSVVVKKVLDTSGENPVRCDESGDVVRLFFQWVK